MSELLRPAAIRSRISRSRGVSWGNACTATPSDALKKAISRAAIAGPKIACPAAADRMARISEAWSLPFNM